MSDEQEKQDKKSHLAQWAVLITAIATLLGAIGFNQFFPDIVKRIMESLIPQPSSSVTSSTPPIIPPSTSSSPQPSSSVTSSTPSTILPSTSSSPQPSTSVIPSPEKTPSPNLEGKYSFGWVEETNKTSVCPASESLVVNISSDGLMSGDWRSQNNLGFGQLNGKVKPDGSWSAMLSFRGYQFKGTISNGELIGTYSGKPAYNSQPCEGTVKGFKQSQ